MIKLKAIVKPERRKAILVYGGKGVRDYKEYYTQWLELEEHVVKGEGHGFSVFYCNDKGEVLADSYGLTLKEAIDIAYADCGVEPEDWRVVDE